MDHLESNTASSAGAYDKRSDADLLEQYEAGLERSVNETTRLQTEATMHRLFQSFQTAACAVAQMYKQLGPTQSQLSQWQEFQNSAGAITLLYKESLEACKSQHELGMMVGQHRKQKEMLAVLKKKKRRANIRKEELINLILSGQATLNVKQPFNGATTAADQSTVDSSAAVSNHLATFREALIMRNASRDPPSYPSMNHRSSHAATEDFDLDLDCFFGEAVHAHHKRSVASMQQGEWSETDSHMDLADSPTRKRGRFC